MATIKIYLCLLKGILTALAEATAAKGTHLATTGGAVFEYMFNPIATPKIHVVRKIQNATVMAQKA